jgi:hypothetical protein
MKTYPRLIRWLLQVGLLGVACAGSAWAAAPTAPRYPLTAEQAVAALAARGIPAAASEISLPMHMTSASASPALEAGKVEHSGAQTRVRLACADHADCLPFYVTILATGPQSDRGPSASVRTPATAEHIPASPPAPEPSLRAGAKATLAIDDHHLHIRVPVICLDAGQPGATIRVRSLDHKQTWQAEVIDRTSVRGSL